MELIAYVCCVNFHHNGNWEQT